LHSREGALESLEGALVKLKEEMLAAVKAAELEAILASASVAGQWEGKTASAAVVELSEDVIVLVVGERMLEGTMVTADLGVY